MKASSESEFRKTPACPSSALLLSFSTSALSPEISALVRGHLNGCEFCTAEAALFAHHPVAAKKSVRAPELPINLRILAESIMSQSRRFAKAPPAAHGLLLAD
jgi:hypothetical protein